jgi:hypothetical protein
MLNYLRWNIFTVLSHLTGKHLVELGIKSVGHRLSIMLFLKSLIDPSQQIEGKVIKQSPPTE